MLSEMGLAFNRDEAAQIDGARAARLEAEVLRLTATQPRNFPALCAASAPAPLRRHAHAPNPRGADLVPGRFGGHPGCPGDQDVPQPPRARASRGQAWAWLAR